MTYKEKLLDPRWQKRRLEILQRDKFKCQLCGDTETTLHVHHKVYRKCEIWEYNDDELITYCKICHQIVEYFKNEEPDISEVISIRKELSQTDEGQLNIIVLLKINNKLFISIFFLDQSTGSLSFILGLKRDTVNIIYNLINKNVPLVV